jgi:hypothetical protein
MYARYNIDDVTSTIQLMPSVPQRRTPPPRQRRSGIPAHITPSTINEAKFGVNRANYHN